MKRKEQQDNSTYFCDFIQTIVPLSKAEQDFIIAKSFTRTIRKSGLIFKPGSEERVLYLIVKGVVRSYMMDSGRQVTTWINEENEVIAPGQTFGLRLPSVEYLQALEPTLLCGMAYEDVEYMYEHFPVANQVGRLLLEDNYRGAEERAYISRISSAAARYHQFVQRQASLLKRVPLKYIASYLNMTSETLSRIRASYRP